MKILVLGIGNILFGDEGIGVHLSNFLKLNYRFSGENEVDFVDGGTPEVIGEETAFTLSDSVKEGAKLMEKLALEFLEQNGIHAEKIDNKDLQEVANGSFRGYE